MARTTKRMAPQETFPREKDPPHRSPGSKRCLRISRAGRRETTHAGEEPRAHCHLVDADRGHQQAHGNSGNRPAGSFRPDIPRRRGHCVRRRRSSARRNAARQEPSRLVQVASGLPGRASRTRSPGGRLAERRHTSRSLRRTRFRRFAFPIFRLATMPRRARAPSGRSLPTNATTWRATPRLPSAMTLR